MPIDRSSLPDQVFRELAEAVLTGRYEPGDRLPGQRAMAAELGVNMASLREGIKRLEQLRLVEVKHGDAMRVLDWRATGGLDVLVYAAAADPTLVRHLFEARRLLLREAARLAAERREDRHAERLAEIADGLTGTYGSDRLAQILDLEFFAVLIEASANLVFTLIVNSIKALYMEHLEMFRPMVADREELLDLYAEAARAIGERDGDAAAAAVEKLAAAQEERMRR